MSENPLPGDIVQIKGKSKLISILRLFSPNLKCIAPFDIEDVHEAYATVLEIEDRSFLMNNIESKVFKLMLENGSDIILPEAAFDIVERGTVDDLGATLTIQSDFGEEDIDRRRAEELMIHHMAAESIQIAFRRYRECKAAIKLKKVTSSQRLVENMAAETISKNLKKVVSKSKLQKGNSSRSLLSQQSAESLPAAGIDAPTLIPVSKPVERTAATAAAHPPTSTPQKPPQPSVSRPSPLDVTAAPAPSVSSSGIAAAFVSPIQTHQEPKNEVELPDGQRAVLHLTSIKASNLGNACWQGVNDVYIVVGVVVYEPKPSNHKIRRSWKYRTETLYEAGASASYPDQDLYLPIQTEEEIESDAVLVVEAYHQGLAIEDKLIGASGDVSLIKLLGASSTVSFPGEAFGVPRSLEVELFEGTGAKRKGRGTAQLSLTLRTGQASTGLGVTVTSPSIVPDAVSIASGSIGVLEFVKRQTSEKTLPKGGKGGLSAASLNAAMDTLNASEGRTSKKNSRPTSAAATSNTGKKEAQTKHSMDDANKSVRSAEPPAQQRRTVSSETSTKLRSEKIPASVVPLASGSYDEAGSYLTGPSHQSSNVSYTSEGLNSNYEQGSGKRNNSANAMRLSVASNRSNHRISSAGIAAKPAEPQEVVPPTQSSLIPPSDFRAVDEAFRLSFKQECAVVKLTIKELTLVLDALGYRVHPTEHTSSMAGGLKYSGAHASYSIASVSSAGSVNSRAVIDLPILHATSLASTVSSIVRDRALLQYDSSVVGSGFEMSKHKAEVAMNHLATLIEGPFTKIREFVLFTCSGELGKNAIRESVGFNGSNKTGGTAAEKKYCRPSHWSEQQVGRLLSLLRIPQDSFNGVDGATLLSIDKQFLAQTHDVKASLLRARFAVYQQLLTLLESWWDVGIRPEDFWNESSVKRKNSLKQSERTKSAGKRRPDPVDVPALVAANKDQVFEVSEFEPLQQQIVSLNRAFGWGLGLDAMSLYSSAVEKLRGKVIPAAGTDVKQNTRIAMKNNQEKISSKSALASSVAASATGSAGHWVELSLRETDHAYAGLMSMITNNRSLESLLKHSTHDKTWLAFVPNACLTPVKSSVSSSGTTGKLSQALQKDEIRLGMFVRITHSEALSRTCERFDWWDRPPPEVLEQMAKSIGEVVSINELDSKQRVGIKVLQSNICDAVPIEALIGPCSTEEVQRLMNASSQTDHEETEEKPVRTSSNRRGSVKKSTRRKSVTKTSGTVVKTPPRPPPPAPIKEEVDPFKAVAESKLRIQKMVKKLKKQYQDEEKAKESQSASVPSGSAMSPLAKDLPPPQKVPNNWMEAPVLTTGDESAPPPPAEDEGDEPEVKLRHSANNPWDGGSPIRVDRADYSWLKPVPPAEKKLDFFKKTAVAAPSAEPAMVVEEIVVDPEENPIPHSQGVSAVHITQATFDAAHAQYRDGIHNGRAPPSPPERATGGGGVDVTPERVHSAGMRGSRPKSASGGPRKAATTRTGTEADMLSSPKFGTESAPFGVSGFGYTAKARAAQYVSDMTNKWVSEEAAAAAATCEEGKSPKKGDKSHLERNKETLAKYFEYSARSNVDTSLGGDHFLFSPPSPEPAAPPQVRGKAEKIVSSRPSSAAPLKNRGVNNRYTANLKVNQSMVNAVEEDMDLVKPRPLSEYIAEEAASADPATVDAAAAGVSATGGNVTPDRTKAGEKSKRKTKSPREEVLKHRESARSQKEADYKENSILRELKKLGVKNPW